jgi:hypothetical protein
MRGARRWALLVRGIHMRERAYNFNAHNKRPTALTSQIDYDHTVIGLPLITSSVFLIDNFGKTWVSEEF